MRAIPILLSGTLIFSAAVSPASAQEFKILGLRALGMGGAHVALAEGGMAQYWNPGSLAFQKGFDLEAPVSAGIQATGDILGKADEISELGDKIQSIQDLQETNGALSLEQVKDFYTAVDKITALNRDGSGVLVGIQGGGNAHVGRLAFSVNNFTEAGATPFIDTRFNLGDVGSGITLSGDGSLNAGISTTDRDALATVITDLNSSFGANLGGTATDIANKLLNEAQAHGASAADITTAVQQARQGSADLQQLGIVGTPGASFKDNRSNVTLRGASLTEFAVGYGYPLPIPDRLGQLGVGGNFKLIRGLTGYKRLVLTSGDEPDTFKDFSKNQKTSVRPAIDLGLQWRTPLPWHTQVGIVARDVNSPKFSQPEEGVAAGEPDYKQAIQTRAGISIRPLRLLTLATDIDLTKNKTAVPGFTSRNWGAGAELNLWILRLRAGLLKNLSGGTPLAYTAGVGLRVFMVAIDIGAAMSSKSVRFKDGTEVPSTVQVGVEVGIRFGGAKK